MTYSLKEEYPMEETTLYETNPAIFRNHPLTSVFSIILILIGVWSLADRWAIALFLFTIGGAALLVMWIHKMSITLTITNRRTILRTGILSKSILEVFHANVRNIQISQTLLQRILRIGGIVIASAAQAEFEIKVIGISHPYKIRELINQYRHDMPSQQKSGE